MQLNPLTRMINVDFPRLLINQNLELLGANNQAAAFLNSSLEKLETTDLKFLVADEGYRQLKSLKDMKKDQYLSDILLVTDDGRKILVDIKASLFYYQNKRLIELTIIKPDHLEKVELKTQFMKKTRMPIIRLSKEGQILYANSASEQLLNKWRAEVGDFAPQFWREFTKKILKTEVDRKIETQIAKETILFSSILLPGLLTGKKSVYLAGHNITELKETEDQVKKITDCDLLTGLPNRNLFIDRLEQLLSKVESKKEQEIIGVLFIDLDDFKKVNDSLGREAGDRLLNQAAQRLKNCIEADDAFLARLNGDEFGLIINQPEGIENISHQVQKINQKFSQAFILQLDQEEQNKVFITISIGVALYPDDSNQAEQLIKNAETAVHKVKETGKDNYCFYVEEMNEEVLREVELEAKLRQGLNDNNFILHYQPQIDVTDNQVCGIEALIRWRDPELGLVSPGEFIPLAEKTGLIIPIGDWVLKAACQELKNLHKQDFSDLKLGVNLSARQFQDDQLIKKVDQVLQDTGLAPQYLELEITESIIMDDVEGSIQKLFKLKDRGVHFSIDDFGTGYSSLSYLKRFPIGTLKIDRSFVSEIPGNLDDTAIVKAIIDLAHNLNLNVIAEGAETAEQIEFLKDNNCDRVQGYYYSRPLPKKEIIKFIEEK